MIRRSNHFTSRLYNRKASLPFAVKPIVIEPGVQEDGGYFTEEDAASYQEKVDNSPRLKEAREQAQQQEREDVQITGERDWVTEDYYRNLAEDRYQGYDQRREPDRYGWDQYAGSGRY